LAGVASRLWRALGRAGVALLLGLAAALVFVGPALEATVHAYKWYSVSPENPGDGGSSSFYLDLTRSHPRVVLGGPGSVSAYVRSGQRVLYLILGPDKAFSKNEIGEIVASYKTGRLRVLDADDLGVTSSLLEALGAPSLGRVAVNPHARGEWSYILTISCNDTTGPASEARELVLTEGSKPICHYMETGGVAAAWLAGPGWSGVMVVGDASIFSNFLYEGSIPWLGSTRRLALGLVEAAGAGEAQVIVVDNTHYNVSDFHYRGHYGVLLLSALSSALASSLESLSAREPLAAALVVPGLAVALSAILTNPTRGLLAPPPRRLRLEEEAVVEHVLTRLGAEFERGTLGSYRPEDAARLVRAALQGWERRVGRGGV